MSRAELMLAVVVAAAVLGACSGEIGASGPGGTAGGPDGAGATAASGAMTSTGGPAAEGGAGGGDEVLGDAGGFGGGLSGDGGGIIDGDGGGGVGGGGEELMDYPLPAIPAACARTAKVITYNPRGWSRILDAFEADPTPCADYFIFLPAVTADKTKPRGDGRPQQVRARAGRFHAVAEVHWGAWSKVQGMSYYDRGVLFRQRMEEAGYNVSRGDTWAINELPSSVRTDASTRDAVRAMVRGLYDGPAGAPKRAGIVYVIAMGQPTLNHAVYEPLLKSWLSRDAFWEEMDGRVAFWGQETYVTPKHTCVPGTVVAEKSAHINAYIQHPARLAAAGPAAAARARAYFDKAYFSLQTAVWKSQTYGQTTNLSLDNMKRLVSLQTHAARAWASGHAYPDGRIGFAWYNNVDGATPAQLDELAERLAASISGAYGVGGQARHACSPSGAYTWCGGCNLSGASFNGTWATYANW